MFQLLYEAISRLLLQNVFCYLSSWIVSPLYSCDCIVFSLAFGKKMCLGHLCLFEFSDTETH